MPQLVPTISRSSVFSKLSTAIPKDKLGTLSCISLIVNKIIGTGIFSNPSIIFKYVDGNVGLFLSLFLLGGIIIFSGLIIYLEFALNLPIKNGGELNYLLRIFKNPKGLTGCIYSFSMVLLGFSSGNSYAFGKYILFAFTPQDQQPYISESLVKLIGVLCISFCIFLHVRYPNQGTQLFNFLGIFKLLILVLIIFFGVAASIGLIDIEPTSNFRDIWTFNPSTSASTSSTSNASSVYNVSVALLEVIYSFKGWENVNYVLNEVEDPYHILTIAAPSAVLLTTILYFLVIISYLIVIPKQELLDSGVLCAGIFFNKIFGETITSTLLPILISLSNLGNVLVVSYAHSLVNQELAINNYLPFSHIFQNLNYSLFLHWFITVIILIGPPSNEIYEFVVNLYIYPGTWINVAISIGLIYLKLNKKKEHWNEFNTIDHSKPKLHLPEEYFEEDIIEDPFTTTANNDNDDEIQDFNPRQRSSSSGSASASATRDRLARLSISSQTALLPHSSSSSAIAFTSQKIIKAPFFCVYLFLIANLFLALFPFVPPPNKDSMIIPFWCFPVIGTGVLLLGAIFFYLRPYVRLLTGSITNVNEIKYEDEYEYDHES
ncbi:amino acid permease-domain-containing protein [Scheffersomyces amazonensis]|uniref:amino acid permease-domain-containing protein n=1 Tax=Scheffersomyces amazonensis TaxID=1078765 RepID=UPI00315D3D82